MSIEVCGVRGEHAASPALTDTGNVIRQDSRAETFPVHVKHERSAVPAKRRGRLGARVAAMLAVDREPLGQAGEIADLGELVVVADEDELAGCGFNQVGDLGKLTAPDHARFINHDDGPVREATGCLSLPQEAGDRGGGDAGGGLEPGGGPGGATEVVMTYVYKAGFVQFDYGYASAVSCLLFVFTAVTTVTYLALRQRSKRHER